MLFRMSRMCRVWMADWAGLVTNAFLGPAAGVFDATDVLMRRMDFQNVTAVIHISRGVDGPGVLRPPPGARRPHGARRRIPRCVLLHVYPRRSCFPPVPSTPLSTPEYWRPLLPCKRVRSISSRKRSRSSICSSACQSYRPSLPGVPKLPTRALQADQQPQPRRAQHGRQDEGLQGAARVLKACKMHARAMCWTHADLVAQANAFADVELHSDGRAPDSWQRGA